MALDGEMTDGAMRAYGQLLVSESAWEDLPVEFRDQSISCAGFRSTSKSICSLFEGEVVRSRMYPFPYFVSVRSDTAEALRWARRVVKDFKDRPCVFDFGATMKPRSTRRFQSSSARNTRRNKEQLHRWSSWTMHRRKQIMAASDAA